MTQCGVHVMAIRAIDGELPLGSIRVLFRAPDIQ